MFTAKLRLFIVIAGLMMIGCNIYSQADSIPVRNDKYTMPPGEITHNLDIGVGFGLDYGGLLGFQLGVAPFRYMTLFAAGGYYMLGFGWQVGIKGLFISKTSKHGFRPFLKGMYGTNSLISVSGADKYDKIYNGFTIGAGLEMRFGKMKKNGFDFDLNVPLRTPEFWGDWNTIKNDPSLEVLQEPIPVAFSVGFHHEF